MSFQNIDFFPSMEDKIKFGKCPYYVSGNQNDFIIYILQNTLSSFVFHRTNKVIQVWNNTRE